MQLDLGRSHLSQPLHGAQSNRHRPRCMSCFGLHALADEALLTEPVPCLVYPPRTLLLGLWVWPVLPSA